MPKMKTPLIAAIGALVLVCALMVSLYLSSTVYRGPDDVLLIEQDETEQNKIESKNLKLIDNAKIDVQNVQHVVESLSRLESYNAIISSQIYIDDTFGTVSCRQQVKNGAYRVDHLDENGNTVYTEITYDDMTYAWRAGSQTVNEMPKGEFSTDMQAMLPTYEDVLELPKNMITNAFTYKDGDEIMIEIDCTDGESVQIYHISLQTGLLAGAEFSENGKMVKRVQVSVLNEAAQEQSFILPNDTVPIYEVN